MISLRYRRVAWLIALLAVLSAGLTAHLTRQRFLIMAGEMSHTIAVREAIAAALTLLTDAETGQRGYLLTGDDAFLEPHVRATSKLDEAIATLTALTRYDAHQEDSVRRFQKLAKEKLAELAETIDLRRKGHADQALAIVHGGHGKRIMDDIRLEATRMLDREQARLADRRHAASAAQEHTSMALLTGLGVAIAIVLAGLAMARRDIEESRLGALKLSESERMFRLLADNASDLVRILADDGSHLYVSPSSKHLLGYRAEELRAMAPESLLPEEDRASFLPGRGDHTSRGTQNIVHRMRAKSGRLRWFETRVTTAPYQPDGRPRMYLASRDITERKQVEDELRRQKTLLQSIVLNMGDGLVVVDAHRKFLIINPAMERYMGQRVGEVSGMQSWSSANQAFLPDGKTVFPPDQGPLSRALEGEASDGVEMVMRHQSDERTFSVTARPLRDGETITGGVAVFHDITEQRLAERDLLESEQRWRVLSEASFEGMAVMRAGYILDTNATFANWLGREPSDLVGMEGMAIFAPDERERVLALSSEGDAGAAYEAHLVRKDGATFPVEVRGRSVVFRGQLVRIVVIRDITERKAQEAELARRAERLRELSLRDELTRLYNRRGFLELARRQLLFAARTQRHLAVFYADLNGMKKINDALGHDKGDAAIVATAGLLAKVFRTSDIIARLGGDEFAILATECDAQGVEAASARLRGFIDQFNQTSGEPFQLSVSIGAAVYDPSAPVDLEALMQQADQRMYQLKRARSDRAPDRRAAGGAATRS